MSEESKTPSIIIKGKTPTPQGEMSQDFQRPNHPDFMSGSELTKIEFSGIRENSITGDVEIWTAGDLRFHMDKKLAEKYPEKFAEAYGRIFQIDVGLINVEER